MESMKAWGMTDQQIQGRNNTIAQREYFLSILYLIQFFVLISEYSSVQRKLRRVKNSFNRTLVLDITVFCCFSLPSSCLYHTVFLFPVSTVNCTGEFWKIGEAVQAT
jgi:hypothetical protein